MLPAFIDNAGEVWPEGSRGLSDHLNTNRAGADLHPFVVNNLGFIHLSLRGRVVSVRLKKSVVTPEAICGLIYWASDNRQFSYLIDEGDNDASPILVPNQRQLLKMFRDRLDTPTADHAYREHAIALENSTFATRWAAAREIVATIGTTPQSETILDALFGGHWTVSEYCTHRNRYKFIGLGRWYYNFDTNARALIGSSPAQFGDSDFGDKVEKAIVKLDDHAAACAHHVRASIKWPNRSVERYDFTRLLVPLSLDGRRLLISAAAVH